MAAGTARLHTSAARRVHLSAGAGVAAFVMSAAAAAAAPPAAACFSPWHVVRVPRDELDVSLALPAGQCFRWECDGAGARGGSSCWRGVLYEHAVHLVQCGERSEVHFRYAPASSSVRTVRARLRDFLRIARTGRGTGQTGAGCSVPPNFAAAESDAPPDAKRQHAPSLTTLYRQWNAADERFRDISPYLRGARVLRQDPCECLFAFICSTNNNIKRISSMVQFLARRYGTPIHTECIAGGGGEADAGVEISNHDNNGAGTAKRLTYYEFPSVSRLAADADEHELRRNGFGYRAKFIVEAARELERRGGDAYVRGLRRHASRAEIHRELTTLSGVGHKVASCVALLSLDCHDDIPVDTHVWQIVTREYVPAWSGRALTDKRYDAIGDMFRERFGAYAGWAHNVLFVAELAEHRTRLPPALRIGREAPSATAGDGRTAQRKAGRDSACVGARASVSLPHHMPLSLPTVTAHRLPCSVAYSGVAPTAGTFFRYAPADADGCSRQAYVNNDGGDDSDDAHNEERRDEPERDATNKSVRTRASNVRAGAARQWRSAFRGRELRGATVFAAHGAERRHTNSRTDTDAVADREEEEADEENSVDGKGLSALVLQHRVLAQARCADHSGAPAGADVDGVDDTLEWDVLARVSAAIYYHHDAPPLRKVDRVPRAFEAARVAQALAARVPTDEAARALAQVIECERRTAPVESRDINGDGTADAGTDRDGSDGDAHARASAAAGHAPPMT